LLRIIAGIVVVAVVAIGGYVVYLYDALHSFEVVRVSDDVHVIQVDRLGGNVGVLATERGAVVVDTMTFRSQGGRILKLAEQVGRGPVQAIVNTHWHQDHTHGNPAFPPGTKVVSTRRTRDYLLHFDADYWTGPAAETLPDETFDDVHVLSVGGKTLRCLHLGAGHTGGDLVVLFVEDRVLHTGDLLFNGRYPNIDLEAGGSVREWNATLDRVLALDFDAVIPGHGPVTDRQGILDFQRFLRQLWQVGEKAAEGGLSLEQALATAELTEDAGYGTIGFPFVFRLDRDFVIRRVWEEATGAARAVEVPAS
jgi:glyoxylase-like metal-dependent hydrolase (beta-lactamase superfamily II)